MIAAMDIQPIAVSIIIITWKMSALLQRLLESIVVHTHGVSYEIVVVDNHSEDGTAEMVERCFPSVRLVRNDVNRGVAAARNQGFKAARGNYFLILDADMMLVENSVRILYEFVESHREVGVAGSMLVSPEGALQYNCKRYPTLGALLLRRLDAYELVHKSRTLQHHMMTDWDHANIREVDYLIGACQMIRREALEKVGLLDERIFYGPEDIDFCIRMHRAGWKVMYDPSTRIIHYEQRMTKRKLFSPVSWKHLMGILYLYWKYRFRLVH